MEKEEIAYQNKDIVSKKFAEEFRGKTFRVYGLDLPQIRQVKPTNIPVVRVNELRIDNLFELEDGTVAIVDYESDYSKADKVKYLNYLTGIANQYQREKILCPMVRMVVIYTGDIERKHVSAEYDIGAVKIRIEPAFLSELDKGKILQKLTKKIMGKKQLADEELMELVILPLAYRKREEKEKGIQEAVDLAIHIQDKNQQLFALAGIMAFTDKMIDRETAEKIRRAIEMTQVAMIFEEEKRQAVEGERKKNAKTLELLVEKENELMKKDNELSEQKQIIAQLTQMVTELNDRLKKLESDAK